jgi:hypothetical protein
MRVYIFILAMTAVYPWLDGLDIQDHWDAESEA